MSIEKEAIDFIRTLRDQCLIKRDMNAFVDYLDEHVSLIGPDGRKIWKNRMEVMEGLMAEIRFFGDRFHINSDWYETVPLHDDTCIVYGVLRIHSNMTEQPDLLQQVSAVCVRTGGGMRLLHLHLSEIKEDAMQPNMPSGSMQMTAINEDLPGGIQRCLNDQYLTLLDVNNRFLTMFGYARWELTERFHDRYLNMIHPSDRANVLAKIQEQLAYGATVELEYRVICKNGRILWILDKGRLLLSNGVPEFCCVLLDVTERKKMEEELRLSLERHRVIMDQTTDIIFEWDIARDTIIYSPNWQKKFGYTPINKEASVTIPKSPNIYKEDIHLFIKLIMDISSGVPYCETEFRIRTVSGEFLWSRIRATTQYAIDGRPIKAVGVILDIDKERKQQEELLERAQKDALTGLYNKCTINTFVEERLQHRDKRSNHALLIIDVDNFKQVNDSYGHLCGDAVLSDVAGTLKELFRSSDLIGRIGGDEFLVFMWDVKNMDVVKIKARSIQEAFNRIRPCPGAPPISCSIGIAMLPQGAVDYYALCRCADRALYYVKNAEKGGFAFYDPSLCNDAVPCGLARSAINETIDSEDVSNIDQQLARYTFRMLFSSVDVKTAIDRILEIVGRAYDVSRVYIFENSEDGLRCSNTFEWCNTGVPSAIDRLQNLSYEEDMGNFLQNFDEDGVFYCRDISKLDPCLSNLLSSQGIISILQCAIREDGEFRGYVGFDECRTNRSWTKEQIASLTLIANVLSTFLLHQRLKERFSALRENPTGRTEK